MIGNKEKNFISVVVYIKDVEYNIEYFLNNIVTIFSNNFEKYEIICVNDSSNDKSVEKIKEFAKNTDGVAISIINMSYYHGLENSMKAGIDFAIGDFIYEFDSTYVDYDELLILKVYHQALKGFDIVSVSPKGCQNITSNLFYKLFNKNSSNKYNLQTERFRIISRRGINRIKSISKTIPYRKAIYSNCGLYLYVFEYEPQKKHNKAIIKEQRHERYNLAIDSLILFTNLADKVSLTMAIIFLLSTLIVAGYTIFVFMNQKPIAGWTTTMLFLAFSFLGVFALFFVIIKYLSILLNLIFKKREYLVQSVEKLS